MTSVEAAKGEQSVGEGSSKSVSFGLKSIKSSGKLLQLEGSPCLMQASKKFAEVTCCWKGRISLPGLLLSGEGCVNFQNLSLTCAFARDHTQKVLLSEKIRRSSLPGTLKDITVLWLHSNIKGLLPCPSFP